MFHPIRHFITITKHRNEVVRLCFKAGIGLQGLFHDLSKYSPTEFIPGAKYYTGKESPNNGERRDTGMSLAWMHHKGRNKHHFEFWYDYDMKTKKIVPMDMPDRYIKEMFCDRVAASKTYNKNMTRRDLLSLREQEHFVNALGVYPDFTEQAYRHMRKSFEYVTHNKSWKDFSMFVGNFFLLKHKIKFFKRLFKVIK